jgi:hypothetical protein
MLEQAAHWNDLSPKLRAELEARIKSFGRRVRYKFNISHENLDREKFDGPVIWPQMYVLDPITFRIVDKHEDRAGKSKSKQIGMVDEVDDKGIPTSFKRVRIHKRHLGVLSFELEDAEGTPNIEDQMQVMYLELHPKLDGGLFSNKEQKQIISRIDEQKEAREGRERRNAKAKALSVATNMSAKEVQDFAAAMQWDEHEEIELLRNRVEDLAETNPQMFNDLSEHKTVEYRATIKRALDKQVIAYNPAEFTYIWPINQQKIVSLGAALGNENEIERFADWLMTNGLKGDEVYKKIKSLVKV